MSLKHGLLGLLAERPMSGYEMTKAFDSSLIFVWSAQHSQIYPELARMHEEGLVRLEEGPGPRGRKTYCITSAGMEELRRWLTRTEPRRADRSDAFLRLFFLWLLPADEAEAFLRGEIEWHSKGLAEYEAILANWRAPEPSWGKVPLELGLRYKRTMIEYFEWAIGEVRAGRYRPGRR